MKMKTIGIAAMAAILALSGCSEGPHEGRVFNGEYHEGYMYVFPCGKSMCPAWQGPTWNLDIYADNGEHGWIGVDETTYHRCNKDERYPECAAADSGDAR